MPQRNTTHISLNFKSCASPAVYYAMAVIAITRLRFNTLWRVCHILKQFRYITLQHLCARNKHSDEVRGAQPTRYIKPMLRCCPNINPAVSCWLGWLSQQQFYSIVIVDIEGRYASCLWVYSPDSSTFITFDFLLNIFWNIYTVLL